MLALLAALSLAHAAPDREDPLAELELTACTDLGPLHAEGDERIEGTLGPYVAAGTEDALVLRDASGRQVWRGNLGDLHPERVDSPDPREVASAFAGAARLRAKGATVKGRGVKATVDEQGVLRGTFKGDSYAWALDLDGRVFGGPVAPGARLSRLPAKLRSGDPFERAGSTDEDAVKGRVAAELMREVGEPLACGPGGKALWIGGDSYPLGGGRVVWQEGGESLVRAGSRTSWFYSLPLGEADAGALAGELGSGGSVGWVDGVGTVRVGNALAVKLPGAPVPRSGAYAWLPLLRPDPAVSAAADPGVDVLGPLVDPGNLGGVELARAINAARASVGVAPLELDAGLTWAALSHCAYLDANDGPAGHRQARDGVAFTGESPADRGGANELVARGGSPWALVEDWLGGAGSRAVLLHPAATSVGACATSRGARVVEVKVAGGARFQPLAVPIDGATDVPRTGDATDGRLVGDVTGLVGPVGPPVTVWVAAPAADVQVLDARITEPSGASPPLYVLRPGSVRGLDNPKEAILHLVPRAPLAAGTDHRWTIHYTVRGEDFHAAGRFRTAADPGDRILPPSGLTAQLLQRIETLRLNGGASEPLRPTVAADAAAHLVAAARSTAGASRIYDRGMGWFCATPGWYATWLARPVGPRPAPDDTLTPLATDLRYGAVGAAADKGELCLLFAVE